MDGNSEHHQFQLPRVEVDREESILLVNKQPLELSDTTPNILLNYIQIGEQAIENSLYEQKKEHKLWGDEISAPSILLGRLALSYDEKRVFTKEGLAIEDESVLSMKDLDVNYRGYWVAVQRANYVPEIRRNLVLLTQPKFDGIWLSMRRIDANIAKTRQFPEEP